MVETQEFFIMITQHDREVIYRLQHNNFIDQKDLKLSFYRHLPT